jgi:hypothetical protein
MVKWLFSIAASIIISGAEKEHSLHFFSLGPAKDAANAAS